MTEVTCLELCNVKLMEEYFMINGIKIIRQIQQDQDGSVFSTVQQTFFFSPVKHKCYNHIVNVSEFYTVYNFFQNRIFLNK